MPTALLAFPIHSNFSSFWNVIHLPHPLIESFALILLRYVSIDLRPEHRVGCSLLHARDLGEVGINLTNFL